MLSGKLPTGTVTAGAETERLGSDRDTSTRRPDGHGRHGRTNGPTTEGTDRPDEPRVTTPARSGGAVGGDERDRRAELERRLTVERAQREAVIDRYERVLADRRASGGGDAGGGTRTATTGVGEVRAWVRRACCRVRLRLSRRG